MYPFSSRKLIQQLKLNPTWRSYAWTPGNPSSRRKEAWLLPQKVPRGRGWRYDWEVGRAMRRTVQMRKQTKVGVVCIAAVRSWKHWIPAAQDMEAELYKKFLTHSKS